MCKGTLHYGPAYAPDGGQELQTLEAMRMYKTWQANVEGWVDIDESLFGVVPSQEHNWDSWNQQVYCEPTK